MTLRAAIQMDDPAGFNFATDSTVALGLEAQRRGYELHYYRPQHLSLENGVVSAPCRPIRFHDNAERFYELGPPAKLDLASCRVVLMRQDPPFDMGYLSATYLLERLPPTTLVVNHPGQVRAQPEKLSVFDFPEFIPPTLITREAGAIAQFLAIHPNAVLKPLYGYGGHGIFALPEGGTNNDALIEHMLRASPDPLVLQKLLPEVTDQERRILIVGGKVGAVFARLPQGSSIRANTRAGGGIGKAELTARQREVCAALGPWLMERGLLFAGIDMIGDWLTEINITSPTGIRIANRLYDISLERLVWDAIEAQLA